MTFPFQQGWTVALPTTFGATYLAFFFTVHLLSLPTELMKCLNRAARGNSFVYNALKPAYAEKEIRPISWGARAITRSRKAGAEISMIFRQPGCLGETL